MSKPKILIIGCGAVGLTQGYYLSSGAAITYLVRPGRAPAFKPPKKLYDYKENALRVFQDYRVIESPSEVAGEDFYCVFDTLDGYSSRSESGKSTLKAVGDLIRDHPSTFFVYDSLGLDIEDHYATNLGIGKERLTLALSSLAHQPTKSISIPASVDASLVEEADMLYSYLPGNYALMAINSKPKLTKALADVYSKHEKLRVHVLPGFLGSSGFLMIAVVQLMSWSIEGFSPFPEFRKVEKTWKLLLEAQQEILSLSRYGWTGWFISWMLGSFMTGKVMAAPIVGALPLQLHEFNAFHHGSKMVKQNLQALQDIVDEGEREQRKMVALREIIRQADEKAALSPVLLEVKLT